MSKHYTANMTLRESRPRSKRLRELGFRGRSSSSDGESNLVGPSEDLFEKVEIGEDEDGNSIFAIRAKLGLFSDSFISAGGHSEIGERGEGTDLVEVWNSIEGNTDAFRDRKVNASHLDMIDDTEFRDDILSLL